MSRKRIFWTFLLFLIASLDLCLIHRFEQGHGFLKKTLLLDETAALAQFQMFRLPLEPDKKTTDNSASEDAIQTNEQLLAYIFNRPSVKKESMRWNEREQKAAPKLYEWFLQATETLTADAVYFPIPEAIDDSKALVTYENSWQFERTYGGTHGHEGSDLMAGIQQRGYYPVVSISDGIVEKIGWLPKGGWRIGIRSPHGAYYYYAHLAEYEDGIAQGDTVAAGQLLGYMGDTGYSEVEGTTGKFPVHLHFGMYVTGFHGEEISCNPYYLLKRLEQNRLRYRYERKT